MCPAAESEQAIAESPVFSAEDATDTKPRGKKRKINNVDDDARLAAMLQAEENSRARPTRTRGAAQRRTLKIRKRGTAANSKTTAKTEDDSSPDPGPMAKQKRAVNRNGGFHVSSCPTRGDFGISDTIEVRCLRRENVFS
jgi:upstream activation factor subunit UAF30